MGTIQVASNQGEVIVFTPERITIGEGAATLRNTVRSLLSGGFPKIALDMALTNHIDSAGIAELIVAFTATNNRGGKLRLNRLSTKPRQLLEITNLATIFQISNQNVDAFPKIVVHSDDVSALKAAETLPLLLTLRDSHIHVELGVQDGIFKVRTGGDDSAGESLIVVAPHALSAGTRTVLYEQLREFEDLINSSSTREEDIHRFLEKNPSFVLGENYRKLHSKVLLEREDDGPLIPDFVLQPFDQELCDLLELKLPGEPVIVGSDNRRRFSSAVLSAVAQLRTYRDYFEDRGNREGILAKYGINAYRPRMSVIIGRLPTLNPLEYRRVADAHKDVRIVTYDELIARARRFLII